MMGISTDAQLNYQWEAQTTEDAVYTQYLETGQELSFDIVPIDKVQRISLIPKLDSLPRHDCVLDLEKGERLVKRFGRGILKESQNGIALVEYLQCVQTTNYRLWVFSSNGRCLVTNSTFELYL